MATENKCTGLIQLDPVEGLVDYILDIKPYHTKVVEVLIEYVYGEAVNVAITDRPEWVIDIAVPTEEIVGSICHTGYSTQPYGDPGLIPIVTPNQAGQDTTYPEGFNAPTNSFTIMGDVTGTIKPGTVLKLKTFVEDYEFLYEIAQVNPGPAGTGSFVVVDLLNDFSTNHPALGHNVETVGSSADDNRSLTIAAVLPNTPVAGYSTVEIAQAVFSEVEIGSIGMVRSIGNNTGTFTVASAVYDAGFIDSWPGYPVIDVPEYIVGNDPHTVITVTDSLNPPNASGPDQYYVAFASVDTLDITEVLSYSNLDTPDEGYVRSEIVGVVPSTFAGLPSLPVPNTASFTVKGDFSMSNLFVGDNLRAVESSNNGVYTITSISYNALLEETTFGVQEYVPNAIVDGYTQVDIPSNVFIVDGNYVSRFVQGEEFTVTGSYAGKYEVLSSDFYNDKTRIRVTRDIVTPDITGPIELGELSRPYYGFGDSSSLCEITPGNIIHTKFDERLSIKGMGLDLYDDIIAYNLEQTDHNDYEFSADTVFSTTPPPTPELDDFWFYETPPGPGPHPPPIAPYEYNTLYRWNTIDWILPYASHPGYNAVIPAVGHKVEIGREIFFVDPGQDTFDFSPLAVPGVDKSLIKVTINGVPANFTLNSASEITLIPVPNWTTADIIEVRVYDRIGPETNAYVGTWNGEPDPFGPLRIDIAATYNTDVDTIVDPDHLSMSNEFVFDDPTEGHPDDQATDATFGENLDFGWGNTQRWAIVRTDVGSSAIYVDGDITPTLDTNDRVYIVGSAGNDDEYEINSFQYLVGTNETEVVVKNPNLLVDTPTSPDLHGYFQLEDIDITDWYQYLIREAKPSAGSPPVFENSFVVQGNATGDIQLGQIFRVLGTSNDGVYTVNTIAFDAPTSTTKIIVAETIPNNELGGWIESFRDYGIRLIFEDSVGMSLEENAAGAVLQTGGNIVDSYDYNLWDVGGYDENLQTVIHLYGNSF